MNLQGRGFNHHEYRLKNLKRQAPKKGLTFSSVPADLSERHILKFRASPRFTPPTEGKYSQESSHELLDRDLRRMVKSSPVKGELKDDDSAVAFYHSRLLHKSQRSQSPESIINLSSKTCYQMTDCQTFLAHKPVHLLLHDPSATASSRLWCDFLQLALERMPAVWRWEDCPQLHSDPLYRRYANVFESMWQTTCQLLQGYYHSLCSLTMDDSVVDNPTMGILHAVAHIVSVKSPYWWEFVERLVHLRCPDEISSKSPQTGRYPLHVAASKSPACKDTGRLIELLTTAYPVAATRVDADNKTAIALALESGLTWRNGLGAIYKASPLTGEAVLKLQSRISLSTALRTSERRAAKHLLRLQRDNPGVVC
jgi:hypothetical protein